MGKNGKNQKYILFKRSDLHKKYSALDIQCSILNIFIFYKDIKTNDVSGLNGQAQTIYGQALLSLMIGNMNQ